MVVNVVGGLTHDRGIRWRSEGELKGPESISAAATTTAGGEKREGERTGRVSRGDPNYLLDAKLLSIKNRSRGVLMVLWIAACRE